MWRGCYIRFIYLVTLDYPSGNNTECFCTTLLFWPSGGFHRNFSFSSYNSIFNLAMEHFYAFHLVFLASLCCVSLCMCVWWSRSSLSMLLVLLLLVLQLDVRKGRGWFGGNIVFALEALLWARYKFHIKTMGDLIISTLLLVIVFFAWLFSFFWICRVIWRLWFAAFVWDMTRI